MGLRAQAGSCLGLLELRGWATESTVRSPKLCCGYGSKWPVHSPLAKVSRLLPAPSMAPTRCQLYFILLEQQGALWPPRITLTLPLSPALRMRPVKYLLELFCFHLKKLAD